MEKVDSILPFNLQFPESSNFNTEILFYSGTPSLTNIFFKSSSKEPRLFVTDETIANLSYTKDFIKYLKNANTNDALIVLGSGESYKTIDSVLKIVKAALEKNFNRDAVFVAIGGGVICDMTGFAASMFKRGVQCEFVPTTLLSCVDASIGGKTGCDFENYKNMIGSFFPARRIHICSDFVLSLPQKEYMSGLGEVIKTALLFSPKLCKVLKEKKDFILQKDSQVLLEIISECAKEKSKIVQKDFREKGERAFLNFGHTFGHALESVAGLGKVTHGEGVAWGISRAVELSAKLNLCSYEYAKEVKDLLTSYGYDTKPIPTVLDKKNVTELLLNAMRKDKKNISANGIRVILQESLCKTIIKEVSEQDILCALQ